MILNIHSDIFTFLCFRNSGLSNADFGISSVGNTGRPGSAHQSLHFSKRLGYSISLVERYEQNSFSRFLLISEIFQCHFGTTKTNVFKTNNKNENIQDFIEA
jgi:hypothetical protein